MSTETILTKIVENVPTACWLAVASWLGYELREWRIWLQNRHGHAPDEGKS